MIELLFREAVRRGYCTIYSSGAMVEEAMTQVLYDMEVLK